MMKLMIEYVKSTELGRCYTGTKYRVTSDIPLSFNDLSALRDIGFLGYGQEFYAKRITRDGELQLVPSVDKLSVNDINTLSDTPPTLDLPGEHRWVYECESRCDSSD